MERQPVSSSNLISIGYDPNSETLEVEFNGGRIYQYFNVPAFEHERLMFADSHGTYFNQNIKHSYSVEQA